jgi:hypothetical protein
MANLLPVAFHGDTLYLVELDGEPFTPARPICEAIGVSWSGQHEKLTINPQRCGVRFTLTPTAGGDQQTICIPVRKLSGWLASINAAKVKPEIREKMEAYQAECDDALWRYWTEGHARRPDAPEAAPVPVDPRQAAAEWIARNGGQFLTPARMYAIQSARLLCHLVNESQHACPEAAAALYHAARAVAVDTLNRVETAEREANYA